MKKIDHRLEAMRGITNHPLFDPRNKLFHEFVVALQIAYDASGAPFGNETRAAAVWVRYRTLTTSS